MVTIITLKVVLHKSMSVLRSIMPAKKRKITSTQRTAFWPCGSCRLNCKSDCIRCAACKQWFHAKCENLSVVDLDCLKNASVTYTCNDCFAIELGTSPYNYHYGLTRMKQVGIQINACLLHVSVRYILLRLDECWIHGEDTLKCDTFFLSNFFKTISVSSVS